MKKTIILLFLSVSFSHGMSWVFGQKPPTPPKPGNNMFLCYSYAAAGLVITASLLTDYLTNQPDKAFTDVCNAIKQDKRMAAVFERRVRCLVDPYNYDLDLDRVSADQMREIYKTQTFSCFKNEIDKYNKHAFNVPCYITELYETEFSVINTFKMPKKVETVGYCLKKADRMNRFQRTADQALKFVKG